MANWRLRNIPDQLPVLQEKLQTCASRASGQPLPTVIELLRDAAASSDAVADLLADDARKRVGTEAASIEQLAASLEEEFGVTAGSVLIHRLHQAGVWAREDGEPRVAAQYHGAAYRMALKTFDLQSAGVQLNDLAVLAASEHAYVAAAQLYERSLALARETGNRREQVTTTLNLGVLAQRQGQLDEAVAILEQAAEAAEADQLLYESARAAEEIGLVRRNQRRFDDAKVWLERAEGGFRRIGATSDLPHVLIGLGKTYRELGRPLESVRARVEAARLLEADGKPDSAAPFYLLAGNSLLKDLQQPQEAKRWLDAALAIFERAQMPEQAAQARSLLAECVVRA
jgi:tetratricopeptide (TPR) repeat protein